MSAVHSLQHAEAVVNVQQEKQNRGFIFFPTLPHPHFPLSFFLALSALFNLCESAWRRKCTFIFTNYALCIKHFIFWWIISKANCCLRNFFLLRNLHEGNASSIKFLSAFHSRSSLRHINEIRKTCEWKGNEENRYVSKQHFSKMDKYRQYFVEQTVCWIQSIYRHIFIMLKVLWVLISLIICFMLKFNNVCSLSIG